MSAAGNPTFLLVELADEHADQIGILDRVADLVRDAGGTVFAQAPVGRVACLEPGSVGASLLIARWDDGVKLRAASRERILPALRSALPATMTPTVLAIEGLPREGLTDALAVPTRASVPEPSRTSRHTFLVIRGSGWDQDKLDRYRDVILPMHKERGGFYEAFALMPGQVEALSGEWTQQIFAISRWPERRLAEDFWFCDRYQNTAIPLRLGAGRFSVHLLEASV